MRELWLFRPRDGEGNPEFDFLALRPHADPRPLAVSNVLGTLTPADVREAVNGMRRSLTRDERTEAVARIVRRRGRTSARVREEEAAYAPDRDQESAPLPRTAPAETRPSTDPEVPRTAISA